MPCLPKVHLRRVATLTNLLGHFLEIQHDVEEKTTHKVRNNNLTKKSGRWDKRQPETRLRKFGVSDKG